MKGSAFLGATDHGVHELDCSIDFLDDALSIAIVSDAGSLAARREQLPPSKWLNRLDLPIGAVQGLLPGANPVRTTHAKRLHLRLGRTGLLHCACGRDVEMRPGLKGLA